IINPEGSIGESGGDFAQTPLISGVLEGYFTMDLVAALAFSVVIVQSFKLNGVNNQKLLVKNVVKAGFISEIMLLIIYFALAYVIYTTYLSGFIDGSVMLTFYYFL